jgi:hypothetical protein
MIRRFLRSLGAVPPTTTLALALACTCACGAGQEAVTAKTAASVSAEQIDADPLALLPGSPLAVVHVDARAILSAPYGEAIGRLADKSMPIGEEAGFLPSRDVDAIWAASYATQGLEGVAVLRGKFDEKKLADAAEKRTQVKGGVLVKSTYADRSVYTVANAGVVVLTAKTALVGSEPAIRRALDRVRAGHLERAIPPWMIDTLATAGAAIAAAADFESQPMPQSVKAQIPVAWLRTVKTAKLVATPESGMRVKSRLAFPSPEDAQGAERGLRQVQTLASALSITGLVPKIEDADLKSDGSDVDCSFRVDERGVGALLNRLTPLLAQGDAFAPARALAHTDASPAAPAPARLARASGD